jgi:hypothetical protein
MTGSLDGMLGAFMDASDMRQNRGRGGRTARTAKGVVEGVWVKCKGEWGDDGEGESEKELDEMIWWSWDGKIVGFRDW